MRRRGFALLAVLWMLVAVTALAAVALSVARIGGATTRNRVLLARAAWAREACIEMLQARYAADQRFRHLDTVDLGRGTWCAAALEDPAARLNVNVATRDELVRLLSGVWRSPFDSALADSLLRRRPFADLAQVITVPGFDSALVARLAPFLSTRGMGAVNVNAAPAEVLRALPGVGDEEVLAITAARAIRPLASADELAARLSPGGRVRVYEDYQSFVRATLFSPAQLVAYASGGVRGTHLVARATLTCVPLPERLAVIRREVE